MKTTDIDIDMADRSDLLKLVHAVDASMINNGIIKKHNVGVYFQDIPVFMDTNMSSINYKRAGDFDFFKIDLLNNSVYEDIESEEQLDALLNHPPDWDALRDESIVSELPHLAKHYTLVQRVRPRSVSDVADLLALMRPAKKYLVELYVHDKEKAKKQLYTKPEDGGFYFKRSHAIAYAASIVVRMNYLTITVR